MQILLSQVKLSTQSTHRRFEVSTCRHVNPFASITPTSEIINTEPNRPPHLSEDHVVVVVTRLPGYTFSFSLLARLTYRQRCGV